MWYLKKSFARGRTQSPMCEGQCLAAKTHPKPFLCPSETSRARPGAHLSLSVSDPDFHKNSLLNATHRVLGIFQLSLQPSTFPPASSSKC